MPPTLRSGRATRSNPGEPADSEASVDLSSPVGGLAGSSRGGAPSSDQPSVKRQRLPRRQQAVKTEDESGTSSLAKGKLASSGAAAAVLADEEDSAGPSTAALKAGQQPPWKKQRGVKRVMAEFHAMAKQPGTQISKLEMVDDNALKWWAALLACLVNETIEHTCM